MNWIILFWVSLCSGIYLSSSQSDFVKKNQSLICNQMSLDNTKLLILVDSLYQNQINFLKNKPKKPVDLKVNGYIEYKLKLIL